MSGTSGFGCCSAEEVRAARRRGAARARATARITVSGSNQFQIPPGQSRTVSSAPIPGTTPRSAGPGSRRLRVDAERDDVDERAQRRVALVARRGRAGRALAQRAEPEVALLLARADERVAGRERDFLREAVQLGHAARYEVAFLACVEARAARASAARRGRRSTRVGSARERAHRRHRQALRDDDVVAADARGHPGRVPRVVVHDLERLVR